MSKQTLERERERERGGGKRDVEKMQKPLGRGTTVLCLERERDREL